MTDLIAVLSAWETVAYALILLLGAYLLTCLVPSYLVKPKAGRSGATPFISVVVPVYQESPETLLPALASWAAVDYPNWELVVADDTPGAPAITYPKWVRVIRRSDRSGFKGGALRNASEQLAPSSEWMAVFDADARVPRDVLRRAATHFNDGTSIVQGYQRQAVSMAKTGGKSLLASFVYAAHWLANRLLYGRWLLGGFVCSQGTTMFYRLSAVREIGGLAPYSTVNEDLDTSFRLKMAGHKIVYDPELVGDGEAPRGIKHFVQQQVRWTSSTVREYRRHLGAFLRSPRVRRREKADSILFLLTWVATLVITPTVAFIPFLFPLDPAEWTFNWGWPGPSLFVLLLPVVFPVVLFTAYGAFHRNLGVGARALGTYFALLVVGYFVSFYSVIVGLAKDCGGYVVTAKGAPAAATLGPAGVSHGALGWHR